MGLLHKVWPGVSGRLLQTFEAAGGNPTLLLLQTAHSWFDAKDISTGAEQTLPNRGTDTATATIGSSTSSDTNDPVLLPHSGTDYVYVPPGPSTDQIFTGNITAPTLHTLDHEAVVRVPPVTADYAYYGRHWSTGGMGVLSISSDRIRLWFTSSGATPNNFTTAPVTLASLGYAPGDWIEIRAVHVYGTSSVEYFHRAEDASTWISMGTSVTATVSAAPTSTSLPVVISVSTTGARNETVLKKLIMRANAAGDPVVDFDVSRDYVPANDNFVDAESNTWTISRGSSGLVTEVVTRPTIIGDGVDDYIQTHYVPSFTETTGELTIIGVYRYPHNTPAAATALWGNYGNGGASGIATLLNPTVVRSFVQGTGGGTLAGSYTPNNGEVFWAAFTVDNGTVGAHADGVNDTASMSGDGDYTQPNDIVLFARNTGTSSNSESGCMTFVVFEERLTNAQIQSIGEYLLAGSYS